MVLANQGMITFDGDLVVSNMVSIVSDLFDEPNVKVKLNSIPTTKVNVKYPFSLIIR